MSFNETEKAAIAEIREKVKDVVLPENLADDYYLLRFLKARSFSIEKTDSFIRETLNWRKANKIDTFLQDYTKPEVLAKYYAVGCLGTAKNGSIVWVTRNGRIDYRGILKSVKHEDFVKIIIWVLEESHRRMREETKKRGKNIDNHYMILDVEGLAMKQIASTEVIKFLRDMVKTVEYYPECLYKVYILNSSKVFQLAYSMITPFMQPTTIKKINIFTDKDPWKEELLKEIDADVLPVHWGGTRVDSNGNPKCAEIIPDGGEIPKEYYTVAAGKLLAELEGVEIITVGGGSTAMVEADITEPGCILKWIFGTKDHDIAFGVYRKTAAGLEEHCPKERVNCSQFAEEGDIECRDPGTYVLAFDNSYSQIRSKKVLFRVEVLPPNEAVEKKLREMQ